MKNKKTTAKKPSIVLIDNKECSAMILEHKEIKNKFNVLPAHSVEEGINLIFSKKPDLVISDVVVPGGDIFGILEKMKINPQTKDIPVVALTTLCSAEDQREVKKSGACDYLLKHECSPQHLAKKIKAIIKKQ